MGTNNKCTGWTAFQTSKLERKCQKMIGRKWQIPVVMICGLCLWCVFDRGLVTAAAALPPEVEPSHSSSTSTTAADVKEIAIISSSDFGETQEIVGPVVESDRTDPALLSATADRSCCRHIGAQSTMLEAFHQFQHNPQVQVRLHNNGHQNGHSIVSIVVNLRFCTFQLVVQCEVQIQLAGS